MLNFYIFAVDEQVVYKGRKAETSPPKKKRKTRKTDSPSTCQPPTYVAKAMFTIKQALKRLDKEKDVTKQSK